MTVSEFDRPPFFTKEEAIKGGWSVRQWAGKYPRSSTNGSAGFEAKSSIARQKRTRPLPFGMAFEPPTNFVRDPYVLEFLNLTDEYGESDFEEAIVRHLGNIFGRTRTRVHVRLRGRGKIRIDGRFGTKSICYCFHRAF